MILCGLRRPMQVAHGLQLRPYLGLQCPLRPTAVCLRANCTQHSAAAYNSHANRASCARFLRSGPHPAY